MLERHLSLSPLSLALYEITAPDILVSRRFPLRRHNNGVVVKIMLQSLGCHQGAVMLTSDNCLQKIMVLLASGPCTPQEPLCPGKKATSELHAEVRIPEEPVARQLTADHARHDGAFQSGSGSDPIVDLGRWSVRLRPPVTGLLAHESPNKKDACVDAHLERHAVRNLHEPGISSHSRQRLAATLLR